jgi:Tol biopolymer transport system component
MRRSAVLSGILVAATVLAPTASEAAYPGSAGRIVFVRSELDPILGLVGFIWTARRDGTDQRQLTTGHLDGHPVWSPDGRRIAFDRNQGDPYYNTRDIFVMNADGSHVRQVTFDPHDDATPTWSPDGRFLAFSSNRREPDPVFDEPGHDVYVIRSTAPFGEPTRVSDLRADDLFSFYEIEPAWSPLGDRIAITPDMCDPFEGAHPCPHLYMLELATGSLSRVPTTRCTQDHVEWAPLGRAIAYMSFCSEDGPLDLVKAGPDGSNEVVLAEMNEGLAWSPNRGTEILYRSSVTEDIYRISSRGGPSVLVIEDANSPDWQPVP